MAITKVLEPVNLPTMTVAELRDAIAKYPADMPVWAAWEGVWAYVKEENFVVERVHKEIDPPRDCLVIDVESY